MKIRVNDETFDYDGSKKPMLEVLAIEKALGMRYGEYEEELQQGAGAALAAFVWSVLHREGRAVTIEEILDGTFELDLGPTVQSLMDAVEELQAGQEAAAATPTQDATAAPRSGRGGTRTTGTGTSRSSRSTTT